MDDLTKRNKTSARNIESWILNRIAILGTTQVAEHLGVNKSSVTQWKKHYIPRMAALLEFIGYSITDDDISRVVVGLADLLEERMCGKKKRPVGAERSDQITMKF
ncbi:MULTISPECIES: CII family transcriptional regulator [Citrobacter freundii complex]|uniref:CII family transcriptional regulator n=1 Tax=Citrobacter portucalensis TaxID=1639133 RepID=UPI0018FFE878|nr:MULTISPECIES: CII family transcriptional regulator [Citrobacter freundii complex]MBJ9871842.1 hypothetical protein [Citrobacter werkmanii]MDK2579416.1 CII family transcriptional regulator [Citrobacter portucalensis]